jgi:hypothetical protein
VSASLAWTPAGAGPDGPLSEQTVRRVLADAATGAVDPRVGLPSPHGCELLLEAMRRDQYGLGRWVMPASINYIGGKTGNYGEWDHESLFFYYRNTPYAIVLYTRGNFAPGNQLGCMMGGLFYDYCA